MDNVKEKKLKEMIVNLKLQIVESRIPKGHCPYTYYMPLNGKTIDCSIDCDKCRKLFMQDIEKAIRAEIEAL